jgi:phosphate transport system substrate-binding protein
LVAVDDGDGCVLPDLETIADGDYALARPTQLIVSQPALARPEVQVVLWELFRDTNHRNLESAGFIGMEYAKLPQIRDMLRRAFNDAQAAAILAAQTAAPEATPEVTPEPGG